MYSQGRSKQSIATQVDVSRNTAKKYFAAFDASGCTFEGESMRKKRHQQPESSDQ